jgi:hypothetical protein
LHFRVPNCASIESTKAATSQYFGANQANSSLDRYLLETGVRGAPRSFKRGANMKRTSRRAWASLALVAGFGALALQGCSGTGGREGEPEVTGRMNLPLTTQGSSGTSYRLRNATFVIQSQDYYYADDGAVGIGGSSDVAIPFISVSSETDPSAANISVSLPEGYYHVRLGSGWSLEKGTAAGPQIVEATLLSGATQWVYVSRQSTSYAEFSFGIGSKEIWLDGKLNIGIDVQEAAAGSSGASGSAGAGGVFDE